MSFEPLRILAQPAFVIPWYVVGAVAGIWVLYDTLTANRDVGPALKAAWPIIVLFFSAIGLVLYVFSCRPNHIGSIVGSSPNPGTAAFWGLAALGLMVGFIFTYPMNWWLVATGWKHGMS